MLIWRGDEEKHPGGREEPDKVDFLRSRQALLGSRVLSCAVLSYAVLCCAVLSCRVLSHAMQVCVHYGPLSPSSPNAGSLCYAALCQIRTAQPELGGWGCKQPACRACASPGHYFWISIFSCRPEIAPVTKFGYHLRHHAQHSTHGPLQIARACVC